MATQEEKNSSRALGRNLTGKVGKIVWVFAIIISLIHLWFNSFGFLAVIKQNLLHLSLMMALTFLITPATKNSPQDSPSIFDWIFFVLTIICGIYFFHGYDALVQRMMMPINADYLYGLTFSLLLLEAARRKLGFFLPSLGLVFLIYIYVGPYMPGMLNHRGFGWKRILSRMTMTSEGVLGVAITVSATYVFLFILFSSFLKVSGASDFFNKISQSIAGKRRGGAAKVSIFASALTGTINGSSQANVVTTGSFTIPLMKASGYQPYFAGAVEAIASTGGIMMPPIMGAAAFIMSALMGVPYTRVITAAITPSILYYFTLYHMVDLRAAKEGISGIPADKIPNFKDVLLQKGYLILPLVIIVATLLFGYSPIMAGFAGIFSCIIAAAISKETRLTFKDILDALAERAEVASSIAVICGIVGFVIGSVGMTGIGQTIGSNLVALAGGRLYLTAIFSMFVAIIMGMGLHITPAYIVTVTVAAPALINLGVDIIPAHFFVFYYGLMSAVIPPVALTSFTAAAVARADTNKVAIYGFFMGAAGLLLPFMFLYNPVILMVDFTPFNYIYSTISIAIGLYFAAIVVIGMLKKPVNLFERLGFGFLAFLLIIPNIYTRTFGILLGLFLYLNHVRSFNKEVESYS